MPYGDGKPHHKATRVILAAVIVVSASGYFMGLRQSSSHLHARQASAPESGPPTETNVPEIRRYSDMRDLPKANAEWINVLSKLADSNPDLYGGITNSEERRLEMEQLRAGRRAYDGAPPVVPHPIDQSSAANCLACHGEGKIIKGRVASRISHPQFANCTQCHVPADGTGVEAGTEWKERLSESGFAGNLTPAKGARAYAGAPPAIPHSTWMRDNCMSCHGPNGTAGIRTTHAYRQSCTQCHAPNAALEQRELLSSGDRPPSVTLPPIGGLQ